jgi:hypothetical protein
MTSGGVRSKTLGKDLTIVFGDIELEKWEKEPAKHYSEIFSQRFRANASAGHDELQGYINRATPSIGYLFITIKCTPSKTGIRFFLNSGGKVFVSCSVFFGLNK